MCVCVCVCVCVYVVNMNKACLIYINNTCFVPFCKQDLSGDIDQKEELAFEVVRDGKVHKTSKSVCVCMFVVHTHTHTP